MSRGPTLLLSAALLGALALAGWQEQRSPWRQHSQAYAGLDPASDSSAPLQLASASGALDRCPTCHRAMLPAAKPGPEMPLRAHPAIDGHAEISRYGCSPCHGGQGRRLDALAHSPRLGDGPDPFLGQPYLQARCARCHIPGGLHQAPALTRGIALYLEAGCTGCHQPGRSEEGLGPDLRRLGRRSLEELRDALLAPRQGHPEAVMWSLRWRFDPETPGGREDLAALLTALLALADSPAPYRRAWQRSLLRPDAPCAACHRLDRGGQAASFAHRCSFLRQTSELRCPRCHQPEQQSADKDARRCPQIQALRPLCPVCHLRPEDGTR